MHPADIDESDDNDAQSLTILGQDAMSSSSGGTALFVGSPPVLKAVEVGDGGKERPEGDRVAAVLYADAGRVSTRAPGSIPAAITSGNRLSRFSASRSRVFAASCSLDLAPPS